MNSDIGRGKGILISWNIEDNKPFRDGTIPGINTINKSQITVQNPWIPGTFCLISLPPPTILEFLFQLPKLLHKSLTLHSEYGKEKYGAGKEGGIFSLLHSCSFYEPVSPGLRPVSLIFPDFH